MRHTHSYFKAFIVKKTSLFPANPCITAVYFSLLWTVLSSNPSTISLVFSVYVEILMCLVICVPACDRSCLVRVFTAFFMSSKHFNHRVPALSDDLSFLLWYLSATSRQNGYNNQERQHLKENRNPVDLIYVTGKFSLGVQRAEQLSSPGGHITFTSWQIE